MKPSSCARLVVLALVVAAAAGCHGGASARHEAASPGGQKRFAELRVVDDATLDYLDPALSYTAEGWQAMWRSYVGFLTYKEVAGPDGATLVPGLAQHLPPTLPGRRRETSQA
jgi:hypothetical protein